jgi:hypothetical protein
MKASLVDFLYKLQVDNFALNVQENFHGANHSLLGTWGLT